MPKSTLMPATTSSVRLPCDNVRALLPFYITQRLHPIDKRIVDDALAQDPALRQELKILRRLHQGVQQISQARDLDLCTQTFMARFTKPEPTWLQRWLSIDRDKIVFWGGGLVAIPGLALNMLEISLADIGNAILDLLRVPDAIEYLQQLFTPAVLESMIALSNYAVC